MNGKRTNDALPSVGAIEAEAARVESMIIAISHNETSQHNLNTFMELHIHKAEMKAYLAGLRYALGHADQMQTRHAVTDENLPEIDPGRRPNAIFQNSEEEQFHLVQCFEC
jgi:hypothetical protein